ncbi:MAG TPA: hypothetical protein VIE13_03575 [Terriglobales bacterium]
MKSRALIVAPLVVAAILVAEVIPTLRHGTLGPAHVAALMVAGVCIGVAYAAFKAGRG